jgi:hypothetical protein
MRICVWILFVIISMKNMAHASTDQFPCQQQICDARLLLAAVDDSHDETANSIEQAL